MDILSNVISSMKYKTILNELPKWNKLRNGSRLKKLGNVKIKSKLVRDEA